MIIFIMAQREDKAAKKFCKNIPKFDQLFLN